MQILLSVGFWGLLIATVLYLYHEIYRRVDITDTVYNDEYKKICDILGLQARKRKVYFVNKQNYERGTDGGFRKNKLLPVSRCFIKTDLSHGIDEVASEICGVIAHELFHEYQYVKHLKIKEKYRIELSAYGFEFAYMCSKGCKNYKAYVEHVGNVALDDPYESYANSEDRTAFRIFADYYNTYNEEFFKGSLPDIQQETD